MPTYTITTDEDADKIAELVRSLDLSKPWSVEIKRRVKNRSHQQNALYWKWLSIIGDHLGYERDELHDYFRERFLAVDYLEILGEQVKRLTRTSGRDFTPAMMADYMDRIERLAAQELGILLPHPEDDHYQTISGM